MNTLKHPERGFADPTATLGQAFCMHITCVTYYSLQMYEVSININLLLQTVPDVKEHTQGYQVGMN